MVNESRVILIYSNVVKEPWTPIGLLYIAANLRKHGIEVKILDWKYDNVFPEIRKFKPTHIGLGGMTIMAEHSIMLGEYLKKVFPIIKLVYGGVHFTFMQDEIKHIADYIIKGEAENSFVKICKSKMPEMIGEARIIDDGLIDDLDYLPFPAYDLINMEKYYDELVTGEKAISILTGRGCPYNCSFCASPFLWKRKVRYHSIQYTMDHIGFLIKNYNLKNLRIMDDTFTCDNSRVIEFCEGIHRSDYKLKMTCLTNVNNANGEVFKEMKKAGFDIVAFGIESANEKVLKLVGKNNSKERVREAVRLAHESGLRTELLFMVGNIGDTKESLRESIEFSKELNGYKTYFQLATPFPGSKFYEVAKEYGTIIDYKYSEYNHKKVKYIPFGLDEKTMLAAVKEGTIN